MFFNTCPSTLNSKACRLQSRVKSGNTAHRISGDSPGDSILRSFGPLPFPFHGNAYILSIRFVGIMAPSGTRRSSFNTRGVSWPRREARDFPRKRNKIRHAFLFDLPRFPVSSFAPLFAFNFFPRCSLLSTVVRAFLALCLSSISPFSIWGKRDGG